MLKHFSSMVIIGSSMKKMGLCKFRAAMGQTGWLRVSRLFLKVSRLSEILLTNRCILLHGLVCFASLHFVVGDKLVCWRSQILAELQQCCLSVRKVSIRHFVVQVHLSWFTGGSHVPSADLRWENHPPTSPFCFAFFKHGDYWLVYEKDGPLQIQGRYGSNRMIEGLKAFLEGVTSVWDSLNH